jgi:hypothetical protein
MENSYVLWFYPALDGGKWTVTHPVMYHQDLSGRAPWGRRFQIVLLFPVHRSPLLSCRRSRECHGQRTGKKSLLTRHPVQRNPFFFSVGIPIPIIFTDVQYAVSCDSTADAIADGFWTSVTFTPPGLGFIFRLFQQHRWGGGITLQRSVRCRFGSHFAPPDLSKNPECKPSLFLFFIRCTPAADTVTQS